MVGATFPGEIARVREIVGDMPGRRHRSHRDTGKTAAGTGLMINSARAILYAGKGEDYAAAARQVAPQTRDAINRWR